MIARPRVRRVVVGAVAVAGLLGWVDHRTVAAQVPAVCPAGVLAVDVPRPHIALVGAVLDRPGPPLRDVIAERRPDVPLTVAARAAGVSPMGDLPATVGGRVCLELPAPARSKAARGKAPAAP